MRPLDPKRPGPLVIDQAGAPELQAFLESPLVRRLTQGRISLIYLVDVRSYAGQAFMEYGLPGLTPHRARPLNRRRKNWGLRGVRLRAFDWAEESECVFVLCHELAHHEAGLEEQHSARWREACVALVREAGELGLLPPERAEQAVAMVLGGAASRFRGWPEHAARQERERNDARREAVSQMRAAGLEVGAQVRFRYRGTIYRGEVVRLNPKTVTVGEPGKGEGLLRVPYERILGVIRREGAEGR